jgi:hypothetical protein
MGMKQLRHQLLVDEFKLFEIGFSGYRVTAFRRIYGPENEVGHACHRRHHHDNSVIQRGAAYDLGALPEPL